jgi:hypothetical protein
MSHRTERCQHGFMSGLCEVISCSHRHQPSNEGQRRYGAVRGSEAQLRGRKCPGCGRRSKERCMCRGKLALDLRKAAFFAPYRGSGDE